MVNDDIIRMYQRYQAWKVGMVFQKPSLSGFIDNGVSDYDNRRGLRPGTHFLETPVACSRTTGGWLISAAISAAHQANLTFYRPGRLMTGEPRTCD